MKKIVKILSWCLYDLSNQFFALNIISIYFTRWIVIEKNVPEIFFSLTFFSSMFLVAVLAPLLGTISDACRRPRLFLSLFTMICIIATIFLSLTHHVVLALVFFAIANFGCQIAVVFYNALLVHVAPPKRLGLISGLGRMFGYSGAAIALFVINPKILPFGTHAIFFATATCFLIFALPSLIFIKDPKSQEPLQKYFNPENLRRTTKTIKKSLKETMRLPGLMPFLKSAFFGLAAVNVVILFMAVYASVVFGLNENQVTQLIGFGTILAIIGSISSGLLSDYFGYRKCLSFVFYLWITSFTLGAIAQGSFHIFFVGGIIGLALGATFSLARAVAASIVPKEKISEAFALFNVVGYVSCMMGALFWGLILFALTPLGVIRYRIALLSLNLLMGLGLFYLCQVPKVAKKQS